MFKNVWKLEISEVMDFFNGYVDILFKFFELEMFVVVQEIKDEQVEMFICDFFDIDWKKEIYYYNQLQNCFDNVCYWIFEDEKFNMW